MLYPVELGVRESVIIAEKARADKAGKSWAVLQFDSRTDNPVRPTICGCSGEPITYAINCTTTKS